MKNESGYTILETMIAISLFLVVVMFGMTSLLNANLIHQKSEDLRSVVDNLSFIMEDISRNLRTGYDYQCFRKGIDNTLSPATLGAPRSCADGWAIAFESADGNTGTFSDQWVYYIDSSGRLFRSTEGATNYVQLTPDEIVINSISGFSVLGAPDPSSGDSQQPIVTIRLTGSITYKSVPTPFFLETSVSQRATDINL